MKTTKLVVAIAISLFSIGSLMAQDHDHSKMEKKQEVKETVYQCPMKCEGEKTYAKAGDCPKCGMALKAKKVTKSLSETYACPMKCEGEKTYDKKGSCPKCGMNLTEQKKAVKKDSKKSDEHKGHHH